MSVMDLFTLTYILFLISDHKVKGICIFILKFCVHACAHELDNN